MKDVEFKFIETNGIKIRLAMMGEGPLVIFCHGWPESWYSYRYQLPVSSCRQVIRPLLMT